MTSRTQALTKPCRCADCGEPMSAGEPFAWKRTTRSRPSYALGAGSGMVMQVQAFKPRHPYDCFAVKVRASQQMEAEREFRDAMEYCRARGITLPPQEIEAMRISVYKARGVEPG